MHNLYDEVRDILHKSHGKGGGPQDTFNRVFQKAMIMTLGEVVGVPKITRKTTTVLLEERQTLELSRIANRPPLEVAQSPYPIGSAKRFKRRVRKSKDFPVIVANFNGKEYLLDGNRRVRYWMENGQPPLKAYVCYIK